MKLKLIKKARKLTLNYKVVNKIRQEIDSCKYLISLKNKRREDNQKILRILKKKE